MEAGLINVGAVGHRGKICYVMLYTTELVVDTSRRPVPLCTFPLPLTGWTNALYHQPISHN